MTLRAIELLKKRQDELIAYITHNEEALDLMKVQMATLTTSRQEAINELSSINQALATLSPAKVEKCPKKETATKPPKKAIRNGKEVELTPEFLASREKKRLYMRERRANRRKLRAAAANKV